MTLPSPPQQRSEFKPLLLCTLFSAVVLTLLGMNQGIAAFAIFAPVFFLLTYSRPDYALFMIFGITLFPYDANIGIPVKTALGDVAMLLAIPAMMSRNTRGLHIPSFIFPVLVYFAVCGISVAANGVNASSLTCILQMALYFIVGVVVMANYSYNPAILQRAIHAIVVFGFFLGLAATVYQQGYVLNMHKNAVGASLAFSALAGIVLWITETDRKTKKRLGFALIIIISGLVSSRSRGAWAGTFVGLCFILAYWGRKDLLWKTILILVPVILAAWFAMPEEARESASGIGLNDYNTKARFESIDYARQYFEMSPVIGVGVGLRKMYDATNLIWSTLAETGVVGLAAFLFLQGYSIFYLWRSRRLLSPTDPRAAIIVVAAGTILSKFTHGLVDHYWSRNLLIPWGCFGMACYIIHAARTAPATRRPLPAPRTTPQRPAPTPPSRRQRPAFRLD